MTNVEGRRDEISKTPCPLCGALCLRIEDRLTAKRLGTFSLSGAQMKFSVVSHPWLVCDGCGAQAPAK